MYVAINPERGGNDIGKKSNNLNEKNLLLTLSTKIYDNLKSKNFDATLLRNKDEEISTDKRINNLLNIYPDKKKTILLSISIGDDNLFEIVYPLDKTDKIASTIASSLNELKETKYYQQRNPASPKQDYYYITRNTLGYESIIILLPNDLNYINDNMTEIANLISNAIIKIIPNSNNTYKVISGDTLYSIARKFNTTVDEIKKLNNLTSNSLSINQVLKIPSQEKKEELTSNNQYKVVSGDTLYGIAKKYNTTVDKLKEINNLKSNTLSIGQILTISNKTYTIKSGDTLYNIARKFNTTVDEIKKLNNLTNNTLTIGKVLIIP